MERHVEELTRRLRDSEARNEWLEQRIDDLEAHVTAMRSSLVEMFRATARELNAPGALNGHRRQLPGSAPRPPPLSTTVPATQKQMQAHADEYVPPAMGNPANGVPLSPELGLVDAAADDEDSVSLHPRDSFSQPQMRRAPSQAPLIGRTLYDAAPRDYFEMRTPKRRRSGSPRERPQAKRGYSPRRQSMRSTSPRRKSMRSTSPRRQSKRSTSPRRQSKRSTSPRKQPIRSVSPRRQAKRSASSHALNGHALNGHALRVSWHGAAKQEWIEPVTNDPTGWDLDGTGADQWAKQAPGAGSRKGGSSREDVEDGEWPVAAGGADGPVMPASVQQMHGRTGEQTTAAKVRAWQQQQADAPEPEPAPDPAPKPVDSGSESDDPLSMLQSRGARLEQAARLQDAGGTALTLERLAPLWGVCGWVREADLARLYVRVYGVELWADAPTRAARTALRSLAGLDEWAQPDGELLLFRRNAHLKSARASQRLFVSDDVPAPVLFYFLATTVLRPLAPSQAAVVARLWADGFGRSPLGLRTRAAPGQRAAQHWTAIDALWQAALDWLCAVARGTASYGRKYMADKLAGWDDRPAADADAGLVFGLKRDELLGLLDVAPLLLQDLLPAGDLLSLQDELDEPI
ncbi:hypothetical protein H4S01_003781 [Coemansia sp. RSA 2610]|nr:hypothetical protein IWW54_001745 [Coemansia sp. RSA 2705]KAJ2364436.1 hypothetical protein H4S01_003781 [Coemansia sp. RSA 2610]